MTGQLQLPSWTGTSESPQASAVPAPAPAQDPGEVPEAPPVPAEPIAAAKPPSSPPASAFEPPAPRPASPVRPRMEEPAAALVGGGVRGEPQPVPIAAPSPRPGGAIGPADFPVPLEAAGTTVPPNVAEKLERRRAELDRRLDLLLGDASAFVAELRMDSLAAQELWLGELAERAVERGIAEKVVAVLRQSGDVDAASLADSFGASVRRAEAEPFRP